mmetsp:Transcript_138127/g.195520  ORF Transcript_138127/g.195520 Transcript_138127/m.195520 type:complete len:161 (+) Transcript_138127:101-583(+)
MSICIDNQSQEECSKVPTPVIKKRKPLIPKAKKIVKYDSMDAIVKYDANSPDKRLQNLVATPKAVYLIGKDSPTSSKVLSDNGSDDCNTNTCSFTKICFSMSSFSRASRSVRRSNGKKKTYSRSVETTSVSEIIISPAKDDVSGDKTPSRGQKKFVTYNY